MAAGYYLLQPIAPYITDNTANLNLAQYLRQMFNLGIALATGLAVIKIVLGGIKLLSTDSIMNHEEGKEDIKNALLGLIIALASYVILNTINPALLSGGITGINK